ncbi:MAG: cupin domain-containing protein [Bacteroidota bacterium]
MRKQFTILLAALLSVFSFSGSAQSFQSLDTIQAPAQYDNIYTRQLASDSLSSTFIIFIKKQVKLHKHAEHTENVIILDGEGEMTLGDKKFMVKKGDMIFIPKGTPHSLVVTSPGAVKVLSIQSPYFDGKDRIFIEQ